MISREYSYRHQEHKARNGEIYALGVSGHSFFNNLDYYNHHSFIKYKSSLNKRKLPIERGRKLEKNEQMIRFVILSLQKTSGVNRNDGGIDKSLFREKFSQSISNVFKKELMVLKRLGLISESDSHIHLTYLGLLYSHETSLFFYLKRDRKKIRQFSRMAKIGT